MSDGAPKVDPEILARLDSITEHAERNGWNAAINACRQLLPVQYSQMLRPLYKVPDEKR